MDDFTSSFDISRVQLEPLKNRKHDLSISDILPLAPSRDVHENLRKVAGKIVQAKRKSAAIVLMMGAHVIRSGVQRYIIDLMKRGYISCIATNGASAIHDFEFAMIGATTESVREYIRNGRFGMWTETGWINDIVNSTYPNGPGMGRAIGRAILEGDFPNKEISIFAQGFNLDIAVTVHVGIGYDIIHEHPNFSGAATGAASHRDFLRFAGVIQSLKNGVIMNFGSAIMGPEVFLKALSMARNVARQDKRVISNFTALVCDLYPVPEDHSSEAPKRSAQYYFRPWKTMLVRAIDEGGESFYVAGPHAETMPALWTAINEAEGGASPGMSLRQFCRDGMKT